MTAPQPAVSLTGLVVDDHTFMRRAMRNCLLAVGVADVVDVSSVQAAREHLTSHPAPSIAVVDLRLGDGSGIDLVPVLRAGGTPVVVFTSADDSYSVRGAYAAGASGYLLKSAEDTLVQEGLRVVLAGQVHVDPSVAGLLVSGVQVNPKHAATPLSPRELEVLRLAADGLSNNQIAERLNVTPLAVKGQFVRIGRKLGARDRTHMVAEAMRADLLR